MILTLRPYQLDLKNRVRAAYSSGKHAPIMVLPTGGGKTAIFSSIAEDVSRRNKHVNILVHRDCILRQTIDLLTETGLNFGVIAPGHTMTGDNIQVSSVYTLNKRLNRAQKPDLIIIDECHHSRAETWSKVINHWYDSRILGVTATPCRLDGNGLGIQAGGFFDSLIVGPGIPELTKQGYLAPADIYVPPSEIDMAGAKKRAGDYLPEEIAGRIDKPKITGDAIVHYRKLCPNAPAVVFCANVVHAQHVAEEFNAAGFAAVEINGKLPKSVIARRLKDFANGVIKIITSCDLISEGFDLPACVAAIGLRPTCSLSLHRQQWGRVLRPFPSKTRAIILDHVGNVFRHGALDTEIEWTLNGSVKRSETDNSIKIKFCKKCYAVLPAQVIKCPQCGEPIIITPEELKQVEGELVKFEAEQERLKLPKPVEYGILLHGYYSGKVDSDEFRKGLDAIEKYKGYKRGWAWLTWNRHSRKKAV